MEHRLVSTQRKFYNKLLHTVFVNDKRIDVIIKLLWLKDKIKKKKLRQQNKLRQRVCRLHKNCIVIFIYKNFFCIEKVGAAPKSTYLSLLQLSIYLNGYYLYMNITCVLLLSDYFCINFGMKITAAVARCNARGNERYANTLWETSAQLIGYSVSHSLRWSVKRVHVHTCMRVRARACTLARLNNN